VKTAHSRFLSRALQYPKLLAQGCALLPFAVIFVGLLAAALIPATALFCALNDAVQDSDRLLQFLAWGVAIAGGFFVFGFSLMLIVPCASFVLRAYAREYRGSYFSAAAARWYFSNALLYLVRYTFLEFVTPTPFSNIFYKLMGMKIGNNVFINTTHISDPAMIDLGDNVTIGGSAVIVAHYAQAGYLIVASVKIGRGTTIGLRSIVMGDTIIGDNARVLPGSVVMPKSRIGAGETWGGVPAVLVSRVE